jgi:hypothetical protein
MAKKEQIALTDLPPYRKAQRIFACSESKLVLFNRLDEEVGAWDLQIRGPSQLHPCLSPDKTEIERQTTPGDGLFFCHLLTAVLRKCLVSD